MLRIGSSWPCYSCAVPTRVAAIGVSHWHSLYDSAYLRHLSGMPDMRLVALQDSSESIAAQRAAALGDPTVYTDYRRMLTETRPDFVIALGRHSSMAETALYLVDQGYPFLMEKPMGIDAHGSVASTTGPPRRTRSRPCPSGSAISPSSPGPARSRPRGNSGRCRTSTFD